MSQAASVTAGSSDKRSASGTEPEGRADHHRPSKRAKKVIRAINLHVYALDLCSDTLN